MQVYVLNDPQYTIQLRNTPVYNYTLNFKSQYASAV